MTLPIIRPGVTGAAFIAMALSLEDFVVTLFTIDGGGTLPIFSGACCARASIRRSM